MEPNQLQNSVASHPKTSAKDFFLHLGTMIALYSTAISLLNLLFTIINKAYPQVGSYYGNYSVSFPVSMMIIMFPIFILLMWVLEKSYVTDPEKRNYGFKKWLTYITLFISGLVTAGDLITVVYYFIDGQEMTTGFIMKVLSVFMVSLAVFMYYITDIRGKLTKASRRVWAVVSMIIILGAIVTGFSVLGSPRSQQLIRYDEQKSSSLQNINSQINYYYDTKKVLPEKLTDLNNNYYANINDPQTQELFEYKKTGDLSYELCAVFNKDSKGLNSQYTSPVYYGAGDYLDYQNHPAGRYCFNQTITPPVTPPSSIKY